MFRRNDVDPRTPMAGEFHRTRHCPVEDSAGLVLQLGGRVGRKFVHGFVVSRVLVVAVAEVQSVVVASFAVSSWVRVLDALRSEFRRGFGL